MPLYNFTGLELVAVIFVSMLLGAAGLLLAARVRRTAPPESPMHIGPFGTWKSAEEIREHIARRAKTRSLCRKRAE